jgi:hypothetical protein
LLDAASDTLLDEGIDSLIAETMPNTLKVMGEATVAAILQLSFTEQLDDATVGVSENSSGPIRAFWNE